MTHRDRVAAKLPAVEPAGVDLPGAELREREQVEEEAHVRGAALDHDRGLGERAPQAGEGLVAVPPPGDQLGDHRVELGGIKSPSATPASILIPGPPGKRSSAIRPGAGMKPSAGSSALMRASIA